MVQGTHERGEEEFSRVLSFSDGLFAIAMTLLVVGISIPHVSNADLNQAVGDRGREIFSFFLSFVVIGYYWLAHHRFMAQLQRVDRGFLTVHLVYLAAIAFAPFPTALVGEYAHAPIAVVLYAITLAAASLLEAVLFAYARGHGLLRMTVPQDVYRFSLIASLLPVAVFVGSIPLALADPSLGTLSWILIFPLEWLLNRWKPTGMDALFR